MSINRIKASPQCGNEYSYGDSHQAYCPPCYNASRRIRYAQGIYKPSIDEMRNRNYKQNYGISEETYISLLEQQNGVCAACGQPETRMNSRIKGRLHVDHDHETGQVRALLCSNCNTALGMLKDETQRIEALLA